MTIGVFRIDDHSLLQQGDGALQILGVDHDLGKPSVRLHVGRVDGDGFAVGLGSRAVVPAAALDVGQRAVGFGVLGIGRDGSLKGLPGFVCIAQAVVTQAHGVDSLGVFGFEFQRLFKAGDRLFVLALFIERDRRFVVELTQLGADTIREYPQLAGLFIGLDRLGILVENLEGHAQGIVRFAVGGVGEDRLFEFDGGVAEVAVSEQFVPGAIVIDGFWGLGLCRARYEQGQQGKQAEATVRQSKSPDLGRGTRRSSGSSNGMSPRFRQWRNDGFK